MAKKTNTRTETPGQAQTKNQISDDAVKAATGKTWKQWEAFLNKKGALDMTHRQIARLLQSEGHIESGWWAQMVTVGYEYATGRRVKGETKDTGFQIGVQKILPVDRETLWKFLLSSKGLGIWMGPGAKKLPLKAGATASTDKGTEAELRTFTPNEKLRLAWKVGKSAPATTLQLYLLERKTGTSLRFHHEKLRDAKHREQMKTHWSKVLERLAAEFG